MRNSSKLPNTAAKRYITLPMSVHNITLEVVKIHRYSEIAKTLISSSSFNQMASYSRICSAFHKQNLCRAPVGRNTAKIY